MTLTSQQEAICKKTIAKMVKYQETYEEVTDHVLTAIEEMDSTKLPADLLVFQIIRNDFGGEENIKQLEEERQRVVLKTLRTKQWRNFKQHFKIPLIGFTLILAAASYFMVDTYINRKVFVFAMLTVGFSPLLLLFYSEIAFQLDSSKVRRSVKTSMLFSIAYISITVFNCINFIPPLFNGDSYKLFSQTNAAILSIITVFFVVYTLSFMKLYREEVQMKLA